MTTQRAEKPMEELIRKRIGEIPILQTVIQRLRLRELLLSYIKSHGNETVPSVDTLLVLVWNVACGRQPLYELPEWVAKLDGRLLEHAGLMSPRSATAMTASAGRWTSSMRLTGPRW